MRCWIDTDIGEDPDDAIALWCAVRHPDVEVVGVSTVGGDVEWRADVARDLLAQAGHRGVPVVAGSPPAGFYDADALLAIGPWTHVAAAPRLPARVALMGGLLEPIVHRGERVEVDWNVAQDPIAADQVLRRAHPLLVVPLNTTVNVVCTAGERSVIARTIPAVSEWPHPLVLHDPLTLLALAGDAHVRVERREIRGATHDVVVWADAPAARVRVVELCA